jgi:Ser/Thr protein kinase RdoA (MazF antagonist)
MAFDELPMRAQVHRLRRTAHRVLARYPIDVSRVRLLHHGFNTTFRVDTEDGRTLSLRLNVNSRREPAWIRAEIAWLAALHADTDIAVPIPQPTRDGELVTTIHSPDLDAELPAVVFSWLPGPDLDDDIRVDQARALGRTMATLHAHAETWSPPHGSELPLFDEPLFGTRNHIDANAHPALTDDRRAVFAEALDRTRAQFATLYAGAEPIALHADLHPGNLKWHRGRLSVLDFDDSGLGVPAIDLATTAYSLRDDSDLEAAVLAGYADTRPAPACTDEQFEAVIASRNLILLNDVLVNVTADIRAIVPTYVANSAIRLRHYLDQGVYRFDVPGVVPLG